MTNAPMTDLRGTTKKCDGGPPAPAGVTWLCDPLKQVWAPVDATATNPSLERPAPHVLAVACPASCAATSASSPRA
ncbi:hypothetical protein [Amycolatopsis vastitatis]|uniref:hypothetical protein n=1 Tax=Amycolatopsis vastitatis TaxID=1905142 RepID=UPI00196A9F35|nr:hypothetical protein [Amycolatopsis vastitatis]